MTSAPDSQPRILAFSLRVVVSLLAAGGSGLTGYYALAQVRSFPDPSFPVVDISLAVMLSAMFLMMTDFAVRWFWLLCSGGFPKSSWGLSRCITCLLFGSFAAVMVSLLFFA